MSCALRGAQLAKLVRRLVAEGVIDADAARDGRITVTDLSRSNPVGLVCLDGCPEIVVKGGTIARDGVDPVPAELAAYEWLGMSPDTARLAPAPLLAVAGATAVVSQWLRGAISLHEALATGTNSGEDLIAEVGRMLGVLHRARHGLRRLAIRRPWILDVPAGRMPAIAIDNDPATRLIEALRQCAPLLATIASVGATWMPRTMIHGDIKFDNILVARDRMLFVDWELAGLGPPAWDLAGVVDGLLVPACIQDDCEMVDAAYVAQLAEPALAAHRVAAGAEFSPSLPELAAATAARLAQTATQLAAMGHDCPDAAAGASRVLAKAVELANRLVSLPVPAVACAL
jgi:Ser/Thr protein kinase RdoA (MazF antagonist)